MSEASPNRIFKQYRESPNIIPKMSRYQLKITHYNKNQEYLNLNDKIVHRRQHWDDLDVRMMLD